MHYTGKQKCLLALATAGGLGFLPKAPGTWGTLAGVLIYFLTGNLVWWIRLLLTLAIAGLSIPIAHYSGKLWQKTDDGRIVIDEVAGYLAGSLFALNFSWLNAAILFALFRLFDITKPWPACFFDQKVENGFGVTMDDLVAGIYAGLLFYLLNYFIL